MWERAGRPVLRQANKDFLFVWFGRRQLETISNSVASKGPASNFRENLFCVYYNGKFIEPKNQFVKEFEPDEPPKPADAKIQNETNEVGIDLETVWKLVCNHTGNTTRISVFNFSMYGNTDEDYEADTESVTVCFC